MTKHGRHPVKRYYEVSEDLFGDQEKLLQWAEQSIAVAKASGKKT